MLYEKLQKATDDFVLPPEDRVRCDLCAHRCVIADFVLILQKNKEWLQNQDTYWQEGHLPGSGEPRRNSLHVGLWAHHHPACGPSGEETTVSLLPQLDCLLHRHSRLQLPLPLVSKLGYLPDGPRAAFYHGGGGKPRAGRFRSSKGRQSLGWESRVSPFACGKPRLSHPTKEKGDSRSIAYTYTEPTIFFEYTYDTARLAHEAGLANIYVTNGYMTEKMLETLHPYLDAANVDLKAFRDETYRKYVGARLQPVLDTMKVMKRLGIWLEVTTLVIGGINDDDGELKDAADFVAGELGFVLILQKNKEWVQNQDTYCGYALAHQPLLPGLQNDRCAPYTR
jgi:hypothetical protein